MCGIFGYVGSETDAPQQTLEGLKKLEYRGYDSWGVAYLNNNKLLNKKKVGKIGAAKIDPTITSNLAIGHTRWATHGGITVANAHPHLSPDGAIAVVHNGVVDNFSQLKTSLKKYHFKSETDTEVITALLTQTMQDTDPLTAVLLTAQKLEGLNAFVVAFAQSKKTIAHKLGSPLLVGKSESGYYLASDNTALAGIAQEVLYLEDNQTVVIADSSVELYDENKKLLSMKWQPLTLSADTVDKQEFPHFMIKEITEQPRVLNTVYKRATEILAFRKNFENKKLMLVGCGSAYHACLAACYLFAIEGKQNAQAFTGSEFQPWRGLVDKNTHVIFVSQSGETIDIVEHAQWLKNNGHQFSAIVNRNESTLARLSAKVIYLQAGPEICVLATKSFTTKLVIFLLLAGVKQASVANDVEALVSSSFTKKYIQPASKVLRKSEHMFILGKNEMYPMALEAALKIKEATYIHAEAFASGELKHGVLALVDKGTPVFALIPDSAAAIDSLTAAQEVKARGGYLIGVGNKKYNRDVFDHFIPVNTRGFSAIVGISVIFQLISYFTTVALGRDPDKPRNLAKSVTVK